MNICILKKVHIDLLLKFHSLAVQKPGRSRLNGNVAFLSCKTLQIQSSTIDI